MKKNIIQIIFFVLYAALMIFFLYECFQPGDKAGNQAGWVASIIAKIQGFFTGKEVIVDDHYRYLVTKLVGHYGIFVLIGLFSIIYHLTLDGFNRFIRILIHFVIGVGFAFGTEFVAEAVTSGRTASIVDVGIDTLGLITLSVPIIIVYLIVILRRERKMR
ncbi:MAG: VanZ family protein [Acholeplasmatales bacterium]|nr:VanZ family protein [Acholeplasmatales bacterium]